MAWFSALAGSFALAALVACKQAGPDYGATGGAGSGGGAGGPSCVEECVADHPAGAKVYDELLSCILCDECFADCGGAVVGCEAPMDAGACDHKGECSDKDSIDTNDCTACALASSCAPVLMQCEDNSDCVKFSQCIVPCP